MKKNLLNIVLTLFMSAALFACSETSINEPIESTNTEALSITELTTTINTLAYDLPTESQIKGLQFMREEEKLARDVYLEMFKKYGIRVFSNISKSEQTHTDAIKALLVKYSIEDPVKNDTVGVFTNADLKTLYDKLITAGNVSDVEALKVGAAIEEIDILDLKKNIIELVNNADIKFVYENLLKASGNHLRAFVKNLSSRGVAYVPQYLDKVTYDSYIN
ncbi:MAG: hypothetical protein FD122_927 [Stygiobacter sp.]|nr:MAG: hypothetical protein FD122_927 [Stygiobacter sp.]KAF0217863.1 MAG: hypothetical protein FD178_397 [Ignavibacteria bacterium]